jgi:hypothetical protein
MNTLAAGRRELIETDSGTVCDLLLTGLASSSDGPRNRKRWSLIMRLFNSQGEPKNARRARGKGLC